MKPPKIEVERMKMISLRAKETFAEYKNLAANSIVPETSTGEKIHLSALSIKAFGTFKI